MRPKDIQNEVRAVDKLREAGTHENIVIVLRHGPLHNSPYYFFDMELCDFNLDHYIPQLWEPTSLETMHLGAQHKPIVDWNLRMKHIWVIMSQIAEGVTFIHLHDEIHRDLKPKNGERIE